MRSLRFSPMHILHGKVSVLVGLYEDGVYALQKTLVPALDNLPRAHREVKRSSTRTLSAVATKDMDIGLTSCGRATSRTCSRPMRACRCSACSACRPSAT
jgi:sulfur relay (sulfurtransferase) complex TusBCD TusD component (DsrE family)